MSAEVFLLWFQFKKRRGKPAFFSFQIEKTTKKTQLQLTFGIYSPHVISTSNQVLRAWSWNSRCGGILVQNRNQYHLLCAIVFDFMVYPNPKSFILKI